jgi:osmotically-inducible protein OsmY
MATATQPLLRRIRTALRQDPHLRHLHVQPEHGENESIVLVGRVESFFQKQLAQEMIRRIDGIGTIENRIEVHG